VIAIFDNYEIGEVSVKALKQWDVNHDEIKLGAMGLLYQDEKGKMKTKK
jgi:hypothetical protein